MFKEKKPEKKMHDLKHFYQHPGAVVATVAVIVLGACLAFAFLLPKGEPINTGGYQVVYMAGGQAYFGQLKNTDGNYLTLKEPYTAQSVAPENAETPEGEEASTTLLKVSQQTYGPEDTISLKSDQVLFWQNLRDDSKVVQAIKNKQ